MSWPIFWSHVTIRMIGTDLRFPSAVKVPAIQHLFNGYPSLTKITEPVSIGPFKSPDSTLNVGIAWFKRAADDDGGTFEVLELHDHFSSSELIPALTIKIGSWLKTMRLDRDFEQHIRRWQFEPRTFLDLTTSCVCVGPHGLPGHLIHKLWQQIALSISNRMSLSA